MHSSTNGFVIELEDVSKRIGKHQVLTGINLRMQAGEILGISGHNGAGKSMLLRIISGLVLPTDGVVSVFGRQVGKEIEFPPNTGVLIGHPGFLPQYSGFTNLWLLSKIRNIITKKDIAETMQSVGLDPSDPRPTRTYSTGMMQRLGLAQAIMEKPQLLLLDEPTNGLDRQGVEDIHRILKDLNSTGVSILLTSHYDKDINTLCTSKCEIERGQLLALYPES